MARFNRSPNPSAAVDLTGWLGTGARTRLTGLVGTPRVTGGSVGVTSAADSASIGPAAGVAAAGQVWAGVLWVRCSVARTVRVTLSTWNTATLVASVGAVDTSLAAGAWTQVRVAGTLPAGTFTGVNVHASVPTSGTAGTLSVSSGRPEQITDPALAYADGASGGGWVWDGVAGSSTSTLPSADTITVGDSNPVPVTAKPTGADTQTTTEALAAVTQLRTGVDTQTQVGQVTSLAAAVTAADTQVAREKLATLTGMEAGAVIDLEFRIVAIAGVTQTPPLILPDFVSATASPIRSSPGAIEIEYPVDGINYATLRDLVDSDIDCEVEVWFDGTATTARRGLLLESSGDDTEEGGTRTFTGHFLEYRLTDAVTPYNTADPQGETKFASANAGIIWATLMGQAVARGCFADITYASFTNTLSSTGVAWTKVATLTISPGTPYSTLMDNLVDAGLCEWEINAAHQLRIYNPGGLGADRTLDVPPVVLRAGKHLIDAPRKHSVRDTATTVVAAGKDGLYRTDSDPTALARRGRRIERFVSQSNLADAGSLAAYSQTKLASLVNGALEITHGLAFGPNDPVPILNYSIGDWVWSDTGNGLERRRVVQWTVSEGPDGSITGTVTLNDVIADARLAFNRRLQSLEGGSIIVGTSLPPSGSDGLAPAAPTEVSASSQAYKDATGRDRASVTATWAAVTTNSDGTAIFDLAGYRVRFRYHITLSGTWFDVAATPTTNSLSWGDVDANADVEVQVSALDRSGNRSAWSGAVQFHTANDTGAPPTPSPPVVTNFLGVLKIYWNGLGSAGQAMPADFDHVEVHLSTVSNFAASATTYLDSLFAAGTQVAANLIYGTTYFAKLVAIDYAGNQSGTSAQGSGIPAKVVNIDLGPDAVERINIRNAAIGSAEIDLLAVNDAHVGNLSVGKLIAGTLSASVLLSGIIRTATTGARVEMDAAGIRVYNTASSLTQRFQASDGSALVTGTIQSATTGTRWAMTPAGELQHYSAGFGGYSQLDSINGDLILRGRLDVNARSGRINANSVGVGINFSSDAEIPNSLRAEMIVTDRTARTTSPFIVLQLNGKLTAPTGNKRVEFHSTDAAGVVQAVSQLFYAPRNLDGLPTIASNQAGFVFAPGSMAVTTGSTTTAGPISATAFNIASSEMMKENVADARATLDPLQVIRGARSKRWNYTWEKWKTPSPTEADPNPAPVAVTPPIRFGPIAEELPAVLHTTILSPTGEQGTALGVSLGDELGVLWGAFGQVIDQRLVHASAAVVLPAGLATTVGTDFDVTTAWAGGPTQTVPALVSLISVGPGPVQQRSITATVVDITTAGVTVRFHTKRLLTGAGALDPDDRYVVNGVFLFTPPYIPEVA